MNKLNYCQYLLSSQNNYTLTNFAESLKKISHDQINRYLKTAKITPSTLWSNVKNDIQVDEEGYLVFNWQKIYYCPLKRNRLVDDTVGEEKYKRIDLLHWNYADAQQGKLIKIKKFPADKKVKLFRVTISTNRTDGYCNQ